MTRQGQPPGKVSAMAVKWQSVATASRAWNTSWYPKTRGQGSAVLLQKPSPSPGA
jgi:hypothetical protein